MVHGEEGPVYQRNGGAITVDYKTAVGLKAQLPKFSGIISKSFRKPKKRFVKEMLYGIQASKDMKLGTVSRTLKEEQSLIKTETDSWNRILTYRQT